VRNQGIDPQLTTQQRRRVLNEQYMDRVQMTLVVMTTSHSTSQMLAIVARTGIYPLLKRIRKFLISNGSNIADLSGSEKERLCMALGLSGFSKNRLVGVLALIVLFDRPPEYMTVLERFQVAKIRQKMRNSLLNAGIVEFLQQMLFLQNWSMSPINCGTNADLDAKFDIFMRQFAWFHAADSHRLLTDPEPRPASPVNQLPAIDNDVV
jgi:hypothetical protein